MNLAVSLIKSAMRAFCQTREILVIDALILHEALRNDNLAHLMQINTRDLHKICGKLREDRFLTVHVSASKNRGALYAVYLDAEEEEAGSDEDEDEIEFEDAPTMIGATPAPATSAMPSEKPPVAEADIKKEDDDDDEELEFEDV